jgi:hypothetical protein
MGDVETVEGSLSAACMLAMARGFVAVFAGPDVHRMAPKVEPERGEDPGAGGR